MKLAAPVPLLWIALGSAAWPQEQPVAGTPSDPPLPPVLAYTGKPLIVPFACTAEDIQWGGLSCSDEDPCPIYLELTTVESIETRILAAGNIHAAAVTLYSIVLGSEDGGQTWREVHPRIRGAGLDHIQLLDAETGWISGQILFPLPQDPFLLLTTDGKTWRQKPVYSESRESRYGSILQFVFSSKSSGALVVDRGTGADGDRYESYESPNSGETWIVKETSSKPLRLKGGAASNTEWRARADGTSQAYQIERRQGERWSSVAAFAVRLGVCKPPVHVTPEPPVIIPLEPPPPPAKKKKK
jgi:hypothetical protein